MYDAELGKLKTSDGVDCPYKSSCVYGKTVVGICPYYWLSTSKNVKLR